MTTPRTTPLATHATVWAAYVGTVKYSVQGISLHATRRDALIAVIEYMRIETDAEDADIDPALDEEDLSDLIETLAEDCGGDWHVEEVTLP